MARGVNSVTLVGNIGQDLELKNANGTPVVNFSLATTETWTKDGQKQEKTEWHRVVCFRKLAEIVCQYASKGRQVFVTGKLQTRKWEKDGVERYTTEIIANEVILLGGRGDSNGDPGAGGDTFPMDGGGLSQTEDDLPW
jgi:single-strand DNA-binding protein